VLGGAIGNIIDRVLYGWLLYGENLFMGRVVDFIHFDVWHGRIPAVVPFLGGHFTALFPIWNVADMAIVVGVLGIIATQGRYHKLLAASRTDQEDSAPSADAPAGDRPEQVPEVSAGDPA